MTSDNCSCYGRCNHDEVPPAETEVASGADVAREKYRQIGGDGEPVGVAHDKMAETVDDLSIRKIRHCVRDLWNAVEQGSFAVETPRVYAEQDTFHSVTISIERDKQEHYSRMTLQGVSMGSPYITMDLEFDTSTELLGVDLREHLSYEGPVVLYGQMHLWRMDKQAGRMDLGSASIGEPIEVDARLEWREVEEAGWR